MWHTGSSREGREPVGWGGEPAGGWHTWSCVRGETHTWGALCGWRTWGQCRLFLLTEGRMHVPQGPTNPALPAPLPAAPGGFGTKSSFLLLTGFLPTSWPGCLAVNLLLIPGPAVLVLISLRLARCLKIEPSPSSNPATSPSVDLSTEHLSGSSCRDHHHSVPFPPERPLPLSHPLLSGWACTQ